jgi:1,4-dihydroxy-2-naphthoate octaprenyltransferase
MALARHGRGVVPAARALGSQVHPVFMLPPVAASLFGAVLVGDVSIPRSALHVTAGFAALYTAHVKDGYVDFHGRGEDDDHPLTITGCRVALAAATGLFTAALLAISLTAGPTAALLTAPGWLIGYLHAPQLDMHPLTATAGYPTGIALALVGGYYVQAETLTAVPVAFAAVFLVVLSGIKIVDDAQDYAYDRSIGKRTVAVVLGRPRARRMAYGLMAVGMVGVVSLAAVGVFPPGAAGAPVVFAAVAVLTRRRDAELSTMLLVRGSYLFLAVLVAAVWFRPLG